MKRSLAFSQSLRYRRICSTDERARFHSNNLEKFLVARQYGRKSVRSQIDKAFRYDLSSTRRSADANSDRVHMVLTLHPGLPKISAKLRDLHDILSADPLLFRAFPLPSRRLVKPECFRLFEHFAGVGHSISDVQFTILSCTVPHRLEEEENGWKCKLDTIFPGGLNVVRETWSNRFLMV